MSLKEQSIGLIGVGLMGHGIASNIVKKGYPLAILNHVGNQPIDDLLASGVHLCDSVKEITAYADIIVLCVTGSPQVESIMYAEDGLLKNLKKGTIIIDCSTALPHSSFAISEAVEDLGAHFIDAPMTRTPKEAAEGKLNLIVGGQKDIFLKVKPLLDSFAENITYAGKVGSGHRLKLIHNFVSLGFTAVLSEAVAVARRADITADVLIEVLEKGGGNSVVLNRLKPYIESDDDSNFKFALSNALKDLTYYTQMTVETHDFQNMADAVKQTFTLCMQEKPDATLPEIVTLFTNKGGTLKEANLPCN